MVRNRKKPDWARLHASLLDTYAVHGADRMVSALRSFQERREHICRRLGVVCDADVSRIASELKRAKVAHVTQ